MNQAVTAALGCEEENSQRAGTKRKYTKLFTPEDRAKIGRYTAENGNPAAVKKFKVTHSIGERALCGCLKRGTFKKQENPEAEVRGVPTLKCGRKVMLGEELDDKLKNYVQALRINGAPIGSSIVMAAGEGLIKAHDRTMLVQLGGHLRITKSWAMSMLKRMGFVKHKATTNSTPGMSSEVFERMKAVFLEQLVRMVKL